MFRVPRTRGLLRLTTDRSSSPLQLVAVVWVGVRQLGRESTSLQPVAVRLRCGFLFYDVWVDFSNGIVSFVCT
jgi:hypothetical protein